MAQKRFPYFYDGALVRGLYDVAGRGESHCMCMCGPNVPCMCVCGPSLQWSSQIVKIKQDQHFSCLKLLEANAF